MKFNMRYSKILLSFFITIHAFLLNAQENKYPDPKELIRKAEKKFKGESGFMESTMKIIRPDWTREVTMKSWSLGEDYSLILITGPARDKGNAFLKRKKEVWNWQPTIERVIKLPPSMMSQSWMGSDFSNDDLVQESSEINDFSHKIIGDTIIEGIQCFKIELIPNEDAAIVWGKMHIWIDPKEYHQLKSEFFDEDMELVNTLYFKDIKPMGDREIATVMEMIPADSEGEKTVIEYQKAVFNEKMEESFFSIQNMKRVR